MALMCWIIGAIISTCGAFIMLEFGSAIPRSGGMKNYLERAFSPRLLQTCIYVFYCVFLQVSASNAITFSSYILVAAGSDATTWKLRGCAIASVGFAVAVHSVAPRVGRALQNAMSLVKLFTLLFIVCCGFAALAGHLKIDKPNNFHNAFEGTSSNGYQIGSAILNVIFSYNGYDNVNAVLSEVKNPQRTLRIALPLSMGVLAVLYTLANVAYFAAVTKEQMLASKVTIAATLFKNMFGDSAGTKALPALVSLSALGHLLGIAFTVRTYLFCFLCCYRSVITFFFLPQRRCPLLPKVLTTLPSPRHPGTLQRRRHALFQHPHEQPPVQDSHQRPRPALPRQRALHLRAARRRRLHLCRQPQHVSHHSHADGRDGRPD